MVTHIHKQPPPQVCFLCGKVYKHYASLHGHLILHSGVIGPSRQCQGCGKIYRWKSALYKHKKKCPMLLEIMKK